MILTIMMLMRKKYNYDDFSCDYDYTDSIDFDISAEEIKAMNWFLGKTK